MAGDRMGNDDALQAAQQRLREYVFQELMKAPNAAGIQQVNEAVNAVIQARFNALDAQVKTRLDKLETTLLADVRDIRTEVDKFRNDKLDNKTLKALQQQIAQLSQNLGDERGRGGGGLPRLLEGDVEGDFGSRQNGQEGGGRPRHVPYATRHTAPRWVLPAILGAAVGIVLFGLGAMLFGAGGGSQGAGTPVATTVPPVEEPVDLRGSEVPPESQILAAARGWDILGAEVPDDARPALGCEGVRGDCGIFSTWEASADQARQERALQHAMGNLLVRFECQAVGSAPAPTAASFTPDGNIQAGGAAAMRAVANCITEAAPTRIAECREAGACPLPVPPDDLQPANKVDWIEPMLTWSLAMIAWHEGNAAGTGSGD